MYKSKTLLLVWLLQARYAAAQAAQIIADSVDSFQSRTDTAFAALNKMEEKINALEYEAAAFLPTVCTAGLHSRAP